VTETTGAGTDPGAGAAGTARRIDKPWGHELIWVVTDRYVGKLIAISAGRRLSLQYHEQKDESIYVLTGRLRLHLEDEGGTMSVRELGPGESARVPVRRRHRFEAVDDVELIEVSTPELDDVVRVEDDFGREGTSAP
jgi:mannose-6-phosphate isomerase-like protein (cupin superfamily)